VDPKHPLWIRLLLRVASRRATDAELGDIVEEYVAADRGAYWLASQAFSIVRRRRSPLTRTERGAEMLSNVWNDIRYSLRTLRRNPGFAIAAIVPIALGIGINTGVFSILNSVAWRPLPVPEPDALVSVYQDFRGGPRRTVHGARTLFSMAEYRAYHDEAQTLSGLMAYSRRWTVTLGRESPQEIDGILVTCNYFAVLKITPATGTGFTPATCGAANAPPVVVLSHAFWKEAFGADPQILQTPIVLNGHEVAVVGIAPIGFDGVDMAREAFFAPTSMAGVFRPELKLDENANVSWLTLIGRRQQDTNIAQVRADLSVVATRIDQQQPGRTTTLIVEPAAALSLPPARRNVLQGASVVLAAFGLVLLIAAANVANILLARATARAREIAIRLSVGATRGRLVQQLLTESIIIALAGAIGGSLLFWWSFQALITVLLSAVPGGEAFRLDATPDRTVLWFALGLTAATALVFGLVPALHASRANVHALTKDGSAGSTGGHGWMRGSLIGAQFALCTMLLIPAGLLSRALYAAQTFDPGFDDRNVAVVSIALPGARYEKWNAAVFHEQWVERVSALPGVARLAQASRIPLSPGRSQATFRLGDESEAHVVDVNTVSPEFFTILNIPIVRGRVFAEDEVDTALVTESTAQRYWPGEDAVGRTINMEGGRRQIVGIVRDAQLSQAQEATSSYLYLPARRGTQRSISVLAKTDVDFGGFAAAVRAETSRMDAGLVVNVQPLSNNLGVMQTLSQITAGIAGVLSLLAVGLASIGIYGVVAYVVSRRRREVGVRMALGAEAGDVQRLILRQTLPPVVIGLTIGIAAAAAIVRLLQSVLFGVSPFDPIAFIGAPLLMLAIAATAALIPTRGAMHVNPMSVLRSE
jgi:putative ABC transport system permease protein